MQIKQPNSAQDFNLSRFLGIVLQGKWYVILALFLIVAPTVLYLRYTPAVYEARSTLQIDVGTDNNVVSIVEGVGKQKFEDAADQAEVIRSQGIVQQVVEGLGLQVNYYQQGRIISGAIYGRRVPFVVKHDSLTFKDYGVTYELVVLDNGTFKIYRQDQPDDFSICTFGKPCIIGNSAFVLEKKKEIPLPEPNTTFQFEVQELNGLVRDINNRLSIAPTGSGSIFQLNYQDEVPDRARDVLNNLCKVYLEDELAIKLKSSDQTIRFIDTLLLSIREQLKDSESSLQAFETENKIPYYTVEKDIRAEKYNAFDQTYNGMMLREMYLKKMEEALLAVEKVHLVGKEVRMVPIFAEAITDQVGQQLSDLNSMVLERAVQSERFTQQSQVILNLNQKIAELRIQALNSIAFLKNQAAEQKQKLYQEQNTLTNQIGGFLAMERNLLKAQQPYQMFNNLYGMLFQKKTEVSIAKAAIISKSRIINPAQSGTEPIKPRRILFIIGSIFFGLFLGVGFVVIREVSRTTVMNRAELEQVTRIPIIGEIFRSKEKTKAVPLNLQVFKHSKTYIAEAFRAMRTNLLFLLPDDRPVVITVTSTVSGEGKSHTALNMAGIFSTLGRKVVLVDLDLRKPRLHMAFNADNDYGVSTYLIKRDSFEDIVRPTGYQFFEYITAGPVPPNPSEMLNSPKFQELMVQLKKDFDIIILDTSPIGLVTDAIPLLKTSDVNLYIFRAETSRKVYLRNLEKLVSSNDIKNLYLVFNYANPKGGGYGYGYGYGYGGGGYTYGYKQAKKAGYLAGVEGESEGLMGWLRGLFKRK